MFSLSLSNRVRSNGFKFVEGFSGYMLAKASVCSDYKMLE